MKRKFFIFFGGVAIAMTLSLGINAHLSNQSVFDMDLNDLHALAVAEGTGNTGPGQMVECSGIFNTKQRKQCMCTNQYDCTESSCQ